MNIKLITILITVSMLSACANYTNLRTITKDLRSTPKCDTANIRLHPRDTKNTLKGKVIVLNSKLDACDDTIHFTDEKLDKYDKL